MPTAYVFPLSVWRSGYLRHYKIFFTTPSKTKWRQILPTLPASQPANNPLYVSFIRTGQDVQRRQCSDRLQLCVDCGLLVGVEQSVFVCPPVLWIDRHMRQLSDEIVSFTQCSVDVLAVTSRCFTLLLSVCSTFLLRRRFSLTAVGLYISTRTRRLAPADAHQLPMCLPL